MDSTHTGQLFIVCFSGSRRGLAGPLETLVGTKQIVVFTDSVNDRFLTCVRSAVPKIVFAVALAVHPQWLLSGAVARQSPGSSAR